MNTGESSDVSDWASTTEVTTGLRATRRWSSRLASSRLAERVSALSDLRARRIAAAALLVAFVLVVIAQWKPWFALKAFDVDFGNADRQARAIGAINALYTLVIPYYLGWTLIAMAGGAAVCGRKGLRRAAVGVAGGALAGQTLVIAATWHDNGVGVYRGLTSPDGVLHSTRQSGIYFAIAALVMVGLALIIAVRGRIIPMADDDPVVAAAPATDDERVDRAEEIDEQPRDLNGHEMSGQGVESGRVAPRSEPSRPEPPDHSMYMRPQDAKINY